MMKSFRFLVMILFAMLVACDGDKPSSPPAPKAQAPAQPSVSTAAPAQTAAPATQAAVPELHELAPSVPVVPVEIGNYKQKLPADAEQPRAAAPAQVAKMQGEQPKTPAPLSKRKPVASKSKPAKEVVKETRLKPPKLDLSLPPEMVEQLDPPKPVVAAQRKPLLPPMFNGKKADEDFQLNGRLLSNEMQLQMRNDNRRDVEGAALDFKFRQ